MQIPFMSKLFDLFSVLGNAPLVGKFSPDQSSHEGVLIKVSLPAQIITRQEVEVNNTNSIEKEPEKQGKERERKKENGGGEGPDIVMRL